MIPDSTNPVLDTNVLDSRKEFPNGARFLLQLIVDVALRQYTRERGQRRLSLSTEVLQRAPITDHLGSSVTKISRICVAQEA